MENVVLIIHLILALGLIAIVLMQRSEGGGLGMGWRAVAAHKAGRSAATALWQSHMDLWHLVLSSLRSH